MALSERDKEGIGIGFSWGLIVGALLGAVIGILSMSQVTN